jgi:hypothetical protein
MKLIINNLWIPVKERFVFKLIFFCLFGMQSTDKWIELLGSKDYTTREVAEKVLATSADRYEMIRIFKMGERNKDQEISDRCKRLGCKANLYEFRRLISEPVIYNSFPSIDDFDDPNLTNCYMMAQGFNTDQSSTYVYGLYKHCDSTSLEDNIKRVNYALKLSTFYYFEDLIKSGFDLDNIAYMICIGNHK